MARIRTADVIVSLALAVGGVYAYHMAVRRAATTPATSEPDDAKVAADVEAIRRSVDLLRGPAAPAGRAAEPPSADLAREVTAVEMRIDALEKALAARSPEPPGAVALPLPASRDVAVTEGEIRDLRALLDAVDSRKIWRMEALGMTRLLTWVEPELPETTRKAALDILLAFRADVRAAYESPPRAGDDAEILAFQKRLADRRARLEEELRAYLPAASAKRIAEEIPPKAMSTHPEGGAPGR